MDPRRVRPGDKRRDRLPHHISSIAHHFLAPEGEDANSGADENAHWCVASPADSPASAFAAAGLLSGLPHPRPDQGPAEDEVVLPGGRFLHEIPGAQWSALSNLDPAQCRPLGSGPRSGPVSSAYTHTWEFTSSAEARDAVEPGAPGVHVHHLGSASEELLELLEAQRAVFPAHERSGAGPSTLAWCIEDRHCGSLSNVHRLGRMLTVLDAGCLELLVFPDAAASRRTWRERIPARIQSHDRNARVDLAETLDMVSCLCPGLPVRTTRLEASGEPGRASSSFAALRSVALRLAGSRE